MVIQLSEIAHKYDITKIKEDLYAVIRPESKWNTAYWPQLGSEGDDHEAMLKFIGIFGKCAFEHNYPTHMKHFFVEKLVDSISPLEALKLWKSYEVYEAQRIILRMTSFANGSVQGMLATMPKDWLILMLRLMFRYDEES